MSPHAWMLTAPIVPTLTRLAAPNIIVMVIALATATAEARYVGQHGTVALAGLALVFPMMMLTNMLSAGSIGGAVAGAVAQRLGAGDVEGAENLALHAVLVGIGMSICFSALFLLGGTAIFSFLGGRDDVLAQAMTYSDIFFTGCVSLWLCNTLGSVIRASGNMIVSALTLGLASAIQVILGGVLILGVGSIPAMGIAGAAWATTIGFGVAALVQLWYLTGHCKQMRLHFSGVRIEIQHFASLLRVGMLASVSPLSSVATVLIITGFVARIGPEVLAGYGIGARLEFLMIPVIFGIGAAAITMVGTHFGAGEIDRAHNIAWIGAFGAALITGLIGLVMALVPGIWADIFSDVEAVRETCRTYLRIVGPCYAFFGLGLCLYFASQGARKVLWPAMASFLRLGITALGGFVVVTYADPTPETFFAVIAIAMVSYGVVTAGAIKLGAWRT